MFHWLTDRRRRKLTEAPFPEAWDEIVKRNVGGLTPYSRWAVRELGLTTVAVSKSWA